MTAARKPAATLQGFNCRCGRRAPTLVGSRLVKGVRYCSAACAAGQVAAAPFAPPSPRVTVCPGYTRDVRYHVPDEPVIGGFATLGIGRYFA